MQVGITLTTVLARVPEIAFMYALYMNTQHFVTRQHFAALWTRIGATPLTIVSAVVHAPLVFGHRLPIFEWLSTKLARKVARRQLVHVTHVALERLW